MYTFLYNSSSTQITMTTEVMLALYQIQSCADTENYSINYNVDIAKMWTEMAQLF